MATKQMLKESNRTAAALNEYLAPELQQVFGLQPVNRAWIHVSHSYHGHIHSKVMIAPLAGVSSLQACYGNLECHLDERRGDRQLNKALDFLAQTRMEHD